MSEKPETKSRQEEARVKMGLAILYAEREAGDQLGNLAERDVPGELRERYWIRNEGDAGTASGIWTFGMSMPRWIKRHELGRNRDEPGDGFRYLYRRGTDGMGSRVEWFEVTEVFEGVEAKDVEAFMRVNNGGTAGFDFDPDRFVRGLEMGTPGRAARPFVMRVQEPRRLGADEGAAVEAGERDPLGSTSQLAHRSFSEQPP